MKRTAFFVSAPLALGLMSAAASDYNPLGFYVGGAVGQARDTYTAFGASDETRTGWKAVAGLKPIPFFGAELEYVDFGTAEFSASIGGGPSGGGFGGTAHATAVGAFGVGYLPLPIPYLSAYAKAGMEHLHTSVNGSAACTPPALCIGPWNVNQTQTDFAYGAGLQAQVEHLAFRAEYERADSSIAHPNLLSFGVTWTF
jgi:opacity protein-like surface antigen